MAAQLVFSDAIALKTNNMIAMPLMMEKPVRNPMVPLIGPSFKLELFWACLDIDFFIHLNPNYRTKVKLCKFDQNLPVSQVV